MKTTFKNIALFLAGAAFLGGCTVVTAERGEYFGYNNNPKIVEPKVSKQQSKSGWKNPLANNNQAQAQSQTQAQDSTVDSQSSQSDAAVAYYPVYTSTYVPVIVPWWSRHYDYWTFYPQPYFYMGWDYGYGFHFGMDWYSPWYNYNPYYGYAWDPYFSRHSYWNYWDNYDYSYWNHNRNYGYNGRDHNGRKYTARTFGPGRGGEFSSNGNGINLRSAARGTTVTNPGSVRSGTTSQGDMRSNVRTPARTDNSRTRDFVTVLDRGKVADINSIRSETRAFANPVNSRNRVTQSQTNDFKYNSNSNSSSSVRSTNRSNNNTIKTNTSPSPNKVDRNSSNASKPSRVGNSSSRSSRPSYSPSPSSTRSAPRQSSPSYSPSKPSGSGSSRPSGGSSPSSGGSRSGSSSGSGSSRSSGRSR